jgi:hypothetical protein
LQIRAGGVAHLNIWKCNPSSRAAGPTSRRAVGDRADRTVEEQASSRSPTGDGTDGARGLLDAWTVDAGLVPWSPGRLDSWSSGACVRYSAGAGRLGAEHRSRHGRSVAPSHSPPEHRRSHQRPEQPPQKEARVTALRTSQTFEELRHCATLAETFDTLTNGPTCHNGAPTGSGYGGR